MRGVCWACDRFGVQTGPASSCAHLRWFPPAASSRLLKEDEWVLCAGCCLHLAYESALKYLVKLGDPPCSGSLRIKPFGVQILRLKI